MKFELKPFNRDVTDGELLKDLVFANEKLVLLGKSLTYRSYREVGKYSGTTIIERFGSWNDAIQKAGLAPTEEKNVSLDALFDNLKVVWIAKGSQPTFRDMRCPPSRYHASTYSARFGGWRKALEEFVAAVGDEEQQFTIFESETKSSENTKRTHRDPSLALRFAVLKRDNFRCVGCGRSPASMPGLVLEVDHVLAWSKGGETLSNNLRTLCFDCNRGKGAT